MSEKIFKQMICVMSDVSGIAKNNKNTAQCYSFRGVDDVYNELNSILAKYGVFTTSEILADRVEERKTAKGGTLIYRILKMKFNFWADDGSTVSSEVIGEGMDSGDKASNKAMSVGHKYALLQAFCIPTEDKKDPENDNPEPVPVAPKEYIDKLTADLKTKDEWVKAATELKKNNPHGKHATDYFTKKYVEFNKGLNNGDTK